MYGHLFTQVPVFIVLHDYQSLLVLVWQFPLKPLTLPLLQLTYLTQLNFSLTIACSLLSYYIHCTFFKCCSCVFYEPNLWWRHANTVVPSTYFSRCVPNHTSNLVFNWASTFHITCMPGVYSKQYSMPGYYSYQLAGNWHTSSKSQTTNDML